MLNHIWLSFSATNVIFQNVWFVAAIWMALALIASLISIRIGISVALIEIFIGVIAGNLLHLTASNEWINFLALLGSGVLTFLAGAEIDPRSLKTNLRASLLIGVLSFAVPFGIVWLFAQLVLGWPLQQAQIAGIALSTTSVAVVYAVMIEGGFSDTAMGKMILAACFITDFGTVLALGGLFANYNLWLLAFVVTTCVVRSCVAGLLGRSRRGGSFSPRQNPGSPDAEHCFRRVHSVLFYQSRSLRFSARALARARRDRWSAFLEDVNKDCWSLAAGAFALHASPGGHLHDVTHGYRPHFRNNLRAFRISEPHY